MEVKAVKGLLFIFEFLPSETWRNWKWFRDIGIKNYCADESFENTLVKGLCSFRSHLSFSFCNNVYKVSQWIGRKLGWLMFHKFWIHCRGKNLRSFLRPFVCSFLRLFSSFVSSFIHSFLTSFLFSFLSSFLPCFLRLLFPSLPFPILSYSFPFLFFSFISFFRLSVSRFESVSFSVFQVWPSPIAQPPALQTWEQEVAGSIPGGPIFFPGIDDSHCDRIHSSLTVVRCFDNEHVGKQPVAWKEYCAEHRLKELQESMDRCTGNHDITEILLKTALNTNQSCNQSVFQVKRFAMSLKLCSLKHRSLRVTRHVNWSDKILFDMQDSYLNSKFWNTLTQPYIKQRMSFEKRQTA